MWRALPTSSLIEEDDAVARRIEETTLLPLGSRAGPAVDEDDGLAIWVAGFFEVELMAGADGETAFP